MSKANNKYTEEFKLEALRLWKISGKTKAQIERELGLSHGCIRKWDIKYTVKEDSQELELSELEQLRRENLRLKKELQVLEQEREILKKTVSIFSQDLRA